MPQQQKKGELKWGVGGQNISQSYLGGIPAFQLAYSDWRQSLVLGVYLPFNSQNWVIVTGGNQAFWGLTKFVRKI